MNARVSLQVVREGKIFRARSLTIQHSLQRTFITFAQNFATAAANSRMAHAKYTPTCHFPYGPHSHR